MDETMLSSNKKLKVIVGNDKKHPLVVRPKSITHLTGVITINANGDYICCVDLYTPLFCVHFNLATEQKRTNLGVKSFYKASHIKHSHHKKTATF